MARRRPRNNGINRNNGRDGYAQGYADARSDAQATAYASSRRASTPSLPAGAAFRPIVTAPSGATWAGLNDRPVSAYDSNSTATMSPTQDNVTFPPGDPLRPVAGYNIRQWLYPVGGNITPTPRNTEMTSFATLRNLAAMYDVIGLCELAHFRIVERLKLAIKPRQELLDAGEDQTADKWTRPARLMQEWFEDGPDKRGGDLTSWMIAVMKDLLEIDAVGVINRPTRDGRLHSLDLIAGDTLKCLWDAEGRTPLPPTPAYQQVLYGAPAALFTTASGRMDGTEIDYLKIVNRTFSMYGEPPTERIILDINSALRKQHYDLTRFTNGATPEGIIETQQPELFKMTVDQVRDWEDAWNAALAGNTALRQQTKFVPPGFHFESTQQQAIATEFDEMLLNRTVSAFGLTKDELGFTDTSNRSVGQSQEAVTYRQAIMPRSSRLAAFFTKIIRRYDGKPLSVVGRSVSAPGAPTRDSGTWDARFLADWIGIEEPEDFTSKVNAYATLVGAGITGRTEAKRALGLPIGKGEVEIPAMILAPNGVDSMVVLEDLVEQRDQINKAHKAALDSKIAGAKAAQEQFENGGNPVMAAGMAAGNLNAGAKQQVAAGGASGGQHAQVQGQGQGQGQRQSPAQAQQTPHPRQNTGGQGRQLAQRAEAQRMDPHGEEREDDDEGGFGAPTQWRPRVTDGDYPRGSAGWDVAAGDGDVLGTGEDDDWGGSQDARGTAVRGTRAGGAGGERGRVSNPAAARLRGDSDGSGQDVPAPAHRGHDDRDGEGGDDTVARGRSGVAVRGGQSAAAREGASRETGIQASIQASPEEISDEWARYRERAIKDAKRGKLPRPFVSDVLPADLHAWVEERLETADSADAVRAVFAEAREREERITSSAAQHTGAMIALMLAPEAASALAIPSEEPASDLHITLAYLGEAADWTQAQRARLIACLAQFASAHSLSAGESGPLGRFPVGEENTYPIYASVNIPGIQAFRAQLVADLARDGLPYDTTHATYVPHITLAYLDANEKPHVNAAPRVPLRFDALTLAMAGERTTFPLRSHEDHERADTPDMPDASYDPLAALAQALVARLEATALFEQRSTLRELRADVSAALRY